MPDFITSLLASQKYSELAKLLVGQVGLGAQLADKHSAFRVTEARQLVAATDAMFLASVAAERDRGVSWEAIGDALGITRSTAHGRFAERIEDMPNDVSAEQSLGQAWEQVRVLVERHRVSPADSVNEMSPADRQKAAAGLAAVTSDLALPAETRVAANQLLAVLEHGTIPAAAGQVLPHDGGQTVLSPVRLLDVSASVEHTAASGAVRNRLSFLDLAIATIETGLEKQAMAGNGQPGAGQLPERLAALRLMRFDEQGDPADIERAIDCLRPAQAAGDAAVSSESMELLAAALNRRYETGQDSADLAESVRLLTCVVDEQSRAFGSGHRQTFRARFGLADTIARLGDPLQAGRQFNELLMDQLRVHSSDHPDVLKTRAAHALALSDCGEHAGAEQILTEQMVIQTRAFGADHPETNVTRAQLLKVMVRRLTETDDTELINRMDLAAWSLIADGLTGNHRIPRQPAGAGSSVPLTAGMLPLEGAG